MTNITYSVRKRLSSRCFELSMCGHAGFCPGNDIVCSALSCLFFSLCNYLDHIGANPDVCYDSEKGEGRIICFGSKKVKAAFDFCIYAFRMLESMYPQNVSVLIP